MRILVYGASGNIGGQVARALAACRPRPELRLLTHRKDAGTELAARIPGAEVAVADLMDTEALAAALAGVDRVFMNVPDMTEEPAATRALLAAAHRQPKPPYILRFGALPPRKKLEELTPATRNTGIGAAKHMRSRLALEADTVPYGILNAPCWFMTNLPWLSGRAIKERNEIVIPGENRTPWIAPADIGAAAAAILTDASRCRTGVEYTLTGPQELDYAQVADILGGVLGRPIRHNGDVEAFRAYFDDMTDMMVEYFVNSRIDHEHLEPTPTLAELLGRQPTTLAEWLGDNCALF
jgi:uncharacterized protein YbjT (DUF2867 family)